VETQEAPKFQLEDFSCAKGCLSRVSATAQNLD